MADIKKTISSRLEPLFPVLLYVRYKQVLKSIDNCLSSHPDILFFFPAYHVGGAEKVHLQIMDTVQKLNISTFITHKSASTALKNEFIKRTKCFSDFNLIGNHSYFRKKIALRIAKYLNQVTKPVTIFGCNNIIFYEIIDQLKNPSIKKIDLIHAFSPYADGIENRSLLSIKQLDLRIVINNTTKENIKTQYESSGIPVIELDKIKVIYNPIENCSFVEKNFKKELKCIWVGRGSDEKRPWIFAKIAQKCYELTLPITFSMIGNVKQLIPLQYQSFLNFYGELHDAKKIKKIYQEHDLLITTSIFEGFPLTITEAVCNGLINISTDVGGIGEHIKNRITGYLIPNFEDENLIVEEFVKILQFILKSPENNNQIIKNAFDYIQTTFSKAIFSELYSKYLINE